MVVVSVQSPLLSAERFVLSAEQGNQLISFTEICTKKGLLARPEGLGEDDCADGLSDPATLLRYLSARQFDSDGALKQLEDTIKFRQENQLVGLFDAIEVSDFEQARQFYPHWTGRRDKQGLPICMFDVGRLDKPALTLWEDTRNRKGWSDSTKEKPSMLQIASVFHDGLIRFVLPLCTMMTDRPNPSTAITSSTYLADASGLGLKQGWSLKTFAQEISWLLATCYPETISKVLVCNAPSYFATIWKYLKKWIDPRTAEKIVVLTNTEALSVLQEYIDIENIPKALGGEYDFTHGMLPIIDDNIRNQFNWPVPGIPLPSGPIKLSKDANGAISAVAVGEIDGVQRRETIFSQV
ncbi:hypothetical protein N7456_001263 [Penicillium angulare]|uniref:CRAL-TRIO domain-containing protein n=1 Tax=Penicillium angulare TaxID=116970 RepID=A0A9W9KSX0_9EURO|nr:hypothetical protein N7456_001263 [Penicillium angulare]